MEETEALFQRGERPMEPKFQVVLWRDDPAVAVTAKVGRIFRLDPGLANDDAIKISYQRCRCCPCQWHVNVRHRREVKPRKTYHDCIHTCIHPCNLPPLCPRIQARNYQAHMDQTSMVCSLQQSIEPMCWVSVNCLDEVPAQPHPCLMSIVCQC